MHLIFIKMMFIFQNTKRKKKCDKETKYQLLYLLFLETESKSILYVLLFFYIGKFTVSCLHHAIPSLLLQKVALSFQCLRPQKEPARRHSVIYSCIINSKLLTVIYFLTRTVLRKCEGHRLCSYLGLFTLLNSIFRVNTVFYVILN